MKVLTIKEPFASLIKEKIKTIETRSWKTKYRGELYIHASKAPKKIDIVKNKELGELIKNLKQENGYIICKCNLVDCIYMDETFLEQIKNNKTEYICGNYKLGRYAWILKDVTPVPKIQAKGKLNIWNYEKDK